MSVYVGELDAGFASEPGFDSYNETFSPGGILGLSVLRALHVWDGSDFWTIADSTMTMSKSGLEIVTPPCDMLVDNGFVFGNADASGKFHHHVSFLLNVPGEPGIYLLSVRVWSLDGASAPSNPAYVVFDQPGHAFVIDDAADWVVEHLAQLDCPVDMNGDGVLNILDFVAFQTAFQTGSGRADANGECALNILDFVAFQTAFMAGCD